MLSERVESDWVCVRFLDETRAWRLTEGGVEAPASDVRDRDSYPKSECTS